MNILYINWKENNPIFLVGNVSHKPYIILSRWFFARCETKKQFYITGKYYKLLHLKSCFIILLYNCRCLYEKWFVFLFSKQYISTLNITLNNPIQWNTYPEIGRITKFHQFRNIPYVIYVHGKEIHR